MKKLLIPLLCILFILTGCAGLREAAIKAREAAVIFSIGGFGTYDTYTVDKRSLDMTIDIEEAAYPRTIKEMWTEEKWDSFISGVLACGDRSIHDGTQWSLTMKGEFDAVEITGSNAYPQGFDGLLSVLSEYFGREVK